MDTKKFAIATVAGSVVLLLTGFVFYGVLLRDFMAANSAPGVMKEVPDMAPLVLGELCIAAFLTLILSRWEGITSFGAGAKSGAVLVLLFALGLNLVFYATMNMIEAVAIPADTVVNTIRMCLAGGVIGLALGRS